MFGPLAFGAVEPWSIFVSSSDPFCSCLRGSRKQWMDGEIELLWNPLFLPMAAFGVLIVVQIVSTPAPIATTRVPGSAVLRLCHALFRRDQSLLRSSQARKLAVIFAVYGFIDRSFGAPPGHRTQRQAVLDPPASSRWLDLRSLRKSQPLCRTDGTADPDSSGACLTRLADEKERIAAGIAAAVMTGTVFSRGSRGGMLAIFVELVVLSELSCSVRKKYPDRHRLGSLCHRLVRLLIWLGGKELTTRVSSISTEAQNEISGGMRSFHRSRRLAHVPPQASDRLGIGNIPRRLPAIPHASTRISSSTKPTTTICKCWLRWDCSDSA